MFLIFVRSFRIFLACLMGTNVESPMEKQIDHIATKLLF
jgi:hypothetical protein